jgi:hypothetical protein
MAASAWRSSISPLALPGRKAILVPLDLRAQPEFRDLPARKGLMEPKDLRDRKDRLGQLALLARPGLLVPWALPDQLGLQDLLVHRALWDSQAHKDRRGFKVSRDLKGLRDRLRQIPNSEPIPTPQQ